MPNFFPAPRFFFGKRGVVLGVAASFLANGCSPPPAVVLPPTKSSAVALAANLKAAKSAKNQSLSAALSRIDGATVTAWINRYAAPSKAPSVATLPQVRIDAEALARRHPAYLLALALERGQISPAAPQIARVLALSLPKALPKSLLESPTASPFELNAGMRVVQPATVLRSGASNLTTRAHQSAALQRFFAAAAARDARRGREENLLQRRALDEALAAAQAGAVGELDLTLVPPDVALELTNLRLQLLRNVSRSPAQRAASREQIRVIEARYAEIWRQQTALRAERTHQLTVEIPARQSREGQARIALETAEDRRNRAAARLEVAAQTSRQMDADFARPTDDLSLKLPATPRLAPLFPTRRATAERTRTKNFETAPFHWPSADAQGENSLLARL